MFRNAQPADLLHRSHVTRRGPQPVAQTRFVCQVFSGRQVTVQLPQKFPIHQNYLHDDGQHRAEEKQASGDRRLVKNPPNRTEDSGHRQRRRKTNRRTGEPPHPNNAGRPAVQDRIVKSPACSLLRKIAAMECRSRIGDRQKPGPQPDPTDVQHHHASHAGTYLHRWHRNRPVQSSPSATAKLPGPPRYQQEWRWTQSGRQPAGR
jgi:hypothetical protein